jgi:hypothetical protein
MDWRSFTVGLVFGLAIAVGVYLDMRQSVEARLSRLEAEQLSMRSNTLGVPSFRGTTGSRDPAAEVPSEEGRIPHGVATESAPGLQSWASSLERAPIKLRGGTALPNGNDGNVGPQR